ncbi:DUF3108 domain-containing protein [Pararhizobium haloflavum]|uniref:DUF3108 domain-containing protein n=1 Tax=Pararhizobium haloflavum TaxID=2037914 RepID=UPI0012FFFDF4|nr:DUF3108 domain-containing protein [Pararhizobium haloflavum]
MRHAFGGIAAALVLYGVTVVAAGAQQTIHRADYRISFIGLPVAEATFSTIFDGERFSIAGEMNSAGVGNIVGRTSGSTSVTGVKTDDRLQASSYVVAYNSGRKSQQMAVAFDNGTVVSAKLTPEKKRTREDWIPVEQADLQSVIDPIGGLMAPGGADVCNRTLPIFDGETRFDVVLTEAGRQPFSTQGFEGEAIVCSARAEPKSGYHAKHSSVAFVRQTSVEVWFAKNEAADVYAPVYARVPTKLGPVTITATHFGS